MARVARILHPDKFLAGELPIDFPPSSVPTGCTAIKDGRRGEQLINETAARCAPGFRAEGWGGDRYLVALSAHGKVVGANSLGR